MVTLRDPVTRDPQGQTASSSGGLAFENVSGSLALDLAGTLWWRRDRPRDLLATPRDAVEWAAGVGIDVVEGAGATRAGAEGGGARRAGIRVGSETGGVGGMHEGGPGLPELRRLVDVRERVYRAVAARLAVRVPELAGVVADGSELRDLLAIAQEPPPRPNLDATGRLHWVGDWGAVYSAVARDALEVLDRLDELTVRECASPRCTRLFIDRSRGKRVWCGMSTCGNRAKAARWRARHRASASATSPAATRVTR